LQNKYGVFVALPKKNITHCIDSTLESIHPTLFEEIFSTSMGLSNFTLLQRQNFRQYVGDINAELFYKGNVRWADIVNDLDIRRAQYDEILSAMKEVYSKSIADQTITCLLICGEAGSGKTTSLMRLAYDSLSNQDLDSAQLLMLAPGAPFDFSQIQGLHNSSISPVIVFVDGFSIQSIVDSFREYLAKSAPINLPLVLVVASRMNEWQNAGGNTVKFSKQINVQLKTLTDSEITQLLEKLDHHNQLYELTPLDQVGRFNKLKDKSSGQLLVAMLEATRGKRFHEIVLDEYQKVREDYPEAARAYELVSLFYFYDVLMPQELLITLVACCDYEDFESRVLQHTYLIIVKHEVTQYGIQYRPRHKEIARILIDSLPDYEFGEKRLRQSSVVLRTLEAADRKQRYVILNFLNNYATSIIKTVSKSDYDFRLNEIRHFLGRNMPKINRMQDQASGGKFVSELVQWSRLFKFLRMQSELISILRRILSLEPFDRMTNYRLAQALQRTREGKDHPEIVADAYKNSFIGGNRRTMFIYEYLSYCLKYGLLNHFDSIMGSVRDFVSFSSEEEDIRDKLIALLNGYRIRKDQAELANRFTSIVAHVEATKDLSAEDEIEYIDKVEVQDIRTTLNDLETHLITISPTRPKGILLRIAHLGSRIPGEEDKAIAFYKEYYDLYVKQNPQKEQHMAVFEYVTFAAKRRLQTKAMNYSLFKLCITLNPVYLNTYFEFCDYAHDCGDDQVAAEYGNQGLKIASQTDRFNSIEARQIRHLLETL
jgi:GTPase SAR1 family protein